jgi:hypothetical protein
MSKPVKPAPAIRIDHKAKTVTVQEGATVAEFEGAVFSRLTSFQKQEYIILVQKDIEEDELTD